MRHISFLKGEEVMSMEDLLWLEIFFDCYLKWFTMDSRTRSPGAYMKKDTQGRKRFVYVAMDNIDTISTNTNLVTNKAAGFQVISTLECFFDH